MLSEWEIHNTSRHQDHVIAHVLGTTVLGYFELDEAAHLILDIGFIWTIYLDGEMGLVLQAMAISELALEAEAKRELRADLQALESGSLEDRRDARITPAPANCLITEVSFYAQGDKRLLQIKCEEASLVISTSLQTGEVHIAPI
jgi:hypothetical protein